MQIFTQHLDYDPRTGLFTYKRNGLAAGCRWRGYIRLHVEDQIDLAHRVAWYFVYGYVPRLIDHINCDKADNRIANLREATKQENALNRLSLYRNNTSGEQGVYQTKTGNYKAQVRRNGKDVYLGTFTLKGEAANAVKTFINGEVK